MGLVVTLPEPAEPDRATAARAHPAPAPAQSDGAAPVPGSVEDALTALADLVREDLAACNRVIIANMHSQVELIPQLAAHLVAAGGKRLRPLLTLACARLCGYPTPSRPGRCAARGAGRLRGVHPHRHAAA